MPSNNSGIRIGHLSGKYPGKIGHLYSPGGQRGPYEFIPYALDNGAFGKKGFDPTAWEGLMDWAKLSGQKPLWALVPDVVADRDGTLAAWRSYFPIAKRYGWPLAFAVQDGMDARDVPPSADVVFVGGTTEWKWRTAPDWCARFPQVHIGRVNTYRLLIKCERMGASSADGTGFTRGNQKQWRDLVAFLQGDRFEQYSLGADGFRAVEGQRQEEMF